MPTDNSDRMLALAFFISFLVLILTCWVMYTSMMYHYEKYDFNLELFTFTVFSFILVLPFIFFSIE